MHTKKHSISIFKVFVILIILSLQSLTLFGQSVALYSFEGELPRRARLGFTTGTVGTQSIFDASQLKVTSVDSTSPAFKSNLRTDDIILSINGEQVSSAISGNERLGNLPGQEQVKLRIKRNGSNKTISFTPDSEPLEGLNLVHTTYGVLETDDGTKLRSLITKPLAAEGKLPAIFLSDWTSCGSVEAPYHLNRGWLELVRDLAERSGMIMMRVDKPGVGDSQGSCSELDFNETIAYQKKAIKELKSRPDVDNKSIFVFGESVGSLMAPIVAKGENVAGIFIYGGGSSTWFERMVHFERKQRELGGTTSSILEIDKEMKDIIRFYHYYLNEGMMPEEIFNFNDDFRRIWEEEVSYNSKRKHYGRPISFHHQAQQHDFTKAWIQADAPGLVLIGKYDQFESIQGAESIVNAVNLVNPGSATLIIYPNLNHQLEVYPTPQAAMRGSSNPVSGASIVLHDILNWMQEIL